MEPWYRDHLPLAQAVLTAPKSQSFVHHSDSLSHTFYSSHTTTPRSTRSNKKKKKPKTLNPSSSLSPLPPSITVNAIQRLEHDDGVSPDDTHPQAHFLVVGPALGGFVEDDVEEDVVAAQRAHNLARAVQLHFDALVEVLLVLFCQLCLVGKETWRVIWRVEWFFTFLSSGWACGIVEVLVWLCF